MQQISKEPMDYMWRTWKQQTTRRSAKQFHTINNMTTGIIRDIKTKIFWSVISTDTHRPLGQWLIDENSRMIRIFYRTERITKWQISLEVQQLKIRKCPNRTLFVQFLNKLLV